MKTCVNCGHQCDTPFCSNCGQKMEVSRVTLKGIFHEFLSKWIGFDNQFGRTVIGMAVKPGEVIRSYLEGNRTRYLGPLGYVVIMTALLIVSFDVFGISVEDFLEQNQESVNPLILGDGQQPTEQQIESQKKVTRIMASNYRFIAGAMIPFWAISLWFFYRKQKLNYIERLVASAYLSCESMWLNILQLGVFAVTGLQFTWYLMGLSVIYYSYGLHKLFPQKNYFLSFVKTFLSFIVASIMFIIAMIVVILIIGIIRVIQNPELIQNQG